jgi:hypothetical protein
MPQAASSQTPTNVVSIADHADGPFAPFDGAPLSHATTGGTDTPTITPQSSGNAGGPSEQFGALSGAGVTTTGAAPYSITRTAARVQANRGQAAPTPSAHLSSPENFLAAQRDTSAASSTSSQMRVAVHPGTTLAFLGPGGADALAGGGAMVSAAGNEKLIDTATLPRSSGIFVLGGSNVVMNLLQADSGLMILAPNRLFLGQSSLSMSNGGLDTLVLHSSNHYGKSNGKVTTGVYP